MQDIREESQDGKAEDRDTSKGELEAQVKEKADRLERVATTRDNLGRGGRHAS